MEETVLQMASFNCSRLFFFLAVTPMTGTPSFPESRSKSMRIPFRTASSIRLTQITAREVISRVWSTRFRFRSRQVASQTMITVSAWPKQRKFRAISSSAEWAIRE